MKTLIFLFVMFPLLFLVGFLSVPYIESLGGILMGISIYCMLGLTISACIMLSAEPYPYEEGF